ncbi:MAG: hypothetical protein ACP5QM_07680 [Caldisericum sp.]|uniref:hypothetical protein n=1 Tax=Caldisericum sp. TaxID=2499687 RepID=UPI003D11CE82
MKNKNFSCKEQWGEVEKMFSGKVGWVQTEMYWIQNHMVAPKEMALNCKDCHTPRSRLNFAALGYPADRAEQLQTMFGFEVKRIQLQSGTGRIEIK